jgi:hypothetical protein
MHDELLLAGNDLFRKSSKDEKVVCVRVRLPWYRSIPLSSIVDLKFKIDGEDIPRTALRLQSNGYVYTLDQLHELMDELWFVLDTKTVEIHLDEPLPEGEHDVRLMAQMHIPYGDRRDFIEYGVCEKKMVYQAA